MPAAAAAAAARDGVFVLLAPEADAAGVGQAVGFVVVVFETVVVGSAEDEGGFVAVVGGVGGGVCGGVAEGLGGSSLACWFGRGEEGGREM